MGGLPRQKNFADRTEPITQQEPLTYKWYTQWGKVIMTELQTILKEALARWEAENHKSTRHQSQRLDQLQIEMQSVREKQKECDYCMKHLNDLSSSLGKLLPKLTACLHGENK